MKRKYDLHIMAIIILLSIIKYIATPLTSSFIQPNNTNITFDIDWKNLIGEPFSKYKTKFSTALIHRPNEFDPWYDIYEYNNCHIYVCKETNRIHHVSIKNSNIMIFDTYVGIHPYEIIKKLGTPTVAETTFAIKNWMIQYAYDDDDKVATRCLTYISDTPETPVTEITYGYTLPLFPHKIGTIDCNTSGKKYLEGTWTSLDSRMFTFAGNQLFDFFTFKNYPQNIKKYTVLSPNKMMITHIRGDNTAGTVTLHYVFNQDYTTLYLFSTDMYGIPIDNTIDEWSKTP